MQYNKSEQLIGKTKELINASVDVSQSVNLSSNDQEYFEYLELLDIEAANKLINQMRNTQLQTFLDMEGL